MTYVNAALARVDAQLVRHSTHAGMLAAIERLERERDELRRAQQSLAKRLDDLQSCLLRNAGRCAICEGPAVFSARDAWLRDHYVCEGCWSLPRERALMRVLAERFPEWRRGTIHESSPASASSNKLRSECPRYLASHFWPDVPLGSDRDGFRCEDLEHQTFPDAAFDLVVTQDVMEHVLDPPAAFREIARTLRPGGAHVFTTPLYSALERTEVRARRAGDRVEHLAPPEYHGNPIDPEGALVTVHYGRDIATIVADACGLETEITSFQDLHAGLLGEFLDVLVTRKPASPA